MPDVEPNIRGQLQYPLDLESEGALKFALEKIQKDIIPRQNRSVVTLSSGATTFNITSGYMVMSANAAVTIATIGGGFEGMILTLEFTDANITITDTVYSSTTNKNTINLDKAFTSSANCVLQLIFNGLSWREVARSVGISTPLSVSDGGTGATTFTDGGVLIGNGTNAVQVTSAGSSGQVLTSNGAGVDPTFQAVSAVTVAKAGNQTAVDAANFSFGHGLAKTPKVIQIELAKRGTAIRSYGTYDGSTQSCIYWNPTNASLSQSYIGVLNDGAGNSNSYAISWDTSTITLTDTTGGSGLSGNMDLIWSAVA